jgi:peptidoglycan/xylan/chitin deacetylase (PgdA/CDA1 family)
MGIDCVPILTYHSLDDTGSVISLAPLVFRDQMRALKRWGFQGICLSDLFDAWEGKRVLPERPVVLTFDDGLRNVGEQAIPVLQEVGFQATLFAVAGYCGRTNDWPGQPARIPRLPLLSVAELRGLAEAGFEVGAHGVVHAPLATLTPREAERELAESKDLLQTGLGRAVSVFAYPYGSTSPALGPLVAAHYRGACGTDLGMACPSDDRYDLPRIDMHYYRARSLFRIFPTRLGQAYLRLRAFGRACRPFLVNPSSLVR